MKMTLFPAIMLSAMIFCSDLLIIVLSSKIVLLVTSIESMSLLNVVTILVLVTVCSGAGAIV